MDGETTAITLHRLRDGGFGLFGVDTDPGRLATAAEKAEAGLRDAVAVRPVTVGTGTLPAVVEDPDDALAAALGADSGEVVVIRPDGRILARLDGADPDRIRELMDTVLQGGSR